MGNNENKNSPPRAYFLSLAITNPYTLIAKNIPPSTEGINKSLFHHFKNLV